MLKFSTDISYSIRRRGKTSGSKSTDVGWPATAGCTLLHLVLSRLPPTALCGGNTVHSYFTTLQYSTRADLHRPAFPNLHTLFSITPGNPQLLIMHTQLLDTTS